MKTKVFIYFKKNETCYIAMK